METPPDPEQAEASSAPIFGEIAASTTRGAVHLTVATLPRSLDYYQQGVGLELLGHSGVEASLGVDGRELLVLVEESGARSLSGYCGLYHFALLLPEREQLAAWLAHA